MNQRKNTLFSLFLFALPSIVSSMIEPIASIVDTALIGNLNTSLLAALSIGITLITTFTYVFNFIVHTTTSSISFLLNTSNRDKLNQTISLSLSTSFVVGVIASVLLFSFRHFLYSLMNISSDLYLLVDQYFEVRSLGHIFVIFYISTIAVLRGRKKVKLAFYLIFLTTLLNIFLSSLFIYSFNMGLQGAALGTVISNIIGSVISLILIFNDGFRFKLKVQKNDFKNYTKDSLFLFLRSLFLSLTFFLSTRQANSLGKNNLAAYQILINLWLFVSFFIDGIAISATIIFSENRQLDDHVANKNRDDYFLFLKLTTLIGAVLSVFYLLFPKYIFSTFTYDNQVINKLNELWMLILIFQIPNAIAFLYDGILFGLSKFKYLAIHMVIGTSFIAFPLIFQSESHHSLKYIFYGHILLNIYRLLSCQFEINKSFKLKLTRNS